jgi:leucyl-tRNA synthetase
MSKSRGNVITPDAYVSELGVDAVRAYLMFIAPWEQGGEWNDSGISGISRWLGRVWNLVLGEYRQVGEVTPEARQKAERDLSRLTHQTIKKVTQDLEKLRFNTMIATLMELTNYLAKAKENGLVASSNWRESVDTFLLLLAPTTPHLAEELWQRTGHDYSIHNQGWLGWDETLAKDEEVTLVIQVNGKLRDRITVPASITEAEARQLASERERVKAYLENKEVANIIYVPARLINFVVR